MTTYQDKMGSNFSILHGFKELNANFKWKKVGMEQEMELKIPKIVSTHRLSPVVMD